MPKIHYCENIINSKICGETNSENFSTGRYNRCKNCRTTDVRIKRQEQKEMSKEDEINKKVEEIKDGRRIQLLVEDIIINKPLMQEGLTVSDWIHILDSKINQKFKNVEVENIILKEKIAKLEEENNFLKIENQKFKNEISQIKNFLEEKFEKYFETF